MMERAKMAQLELFDEDCGKDYVKSFDDKYTQKIKIPHYQPKGSISCIDELYDRSKRNTLIEKINGSSISDAEKQFLIDAAYRHDVFHFDRIAEYYVNASEEMQGLMEESGLVIIDVGDAIANGYVRLNKRIKELLNVQ